MMEKNTKYDQYLEMLNLIEDYYSTGYKHNHRKLKATGFTKKDKSNNSLDELSKLEQEIKNCKKCGLHADRNNAVPGEGVRNPLVLIIGEGPGEEEDKSGRPFVGKAGKYLDKWLGAVKLENNEVLSRQNNVFIANIIKCRPPGNRDPRPEEIEKCRAYLEEQIQILKPKVILTISRFAAKVLLNTDSGITRLRGKKYEYQTIPLIPTYHPSAVLRNPELRSPVWEDLKLLKSVLEKNI